MDVFEFANRHLGKYARKGDEIIPKYCPFCHGGSNNDKETFALNTVKKTYNCKRGSCNEQGAFFQLCAKFGEKADNNNDFEVYKTKKHYKKPTTELRPITNQVENYLALRKISKKTMDLLTVSSDDKGNIVFPYFEDKELVFVKFRPSKKVEKGERKAWRESETKPILWGMQLCDISKPLIITEGEIDTLSLYECGLENAVSVPSGSEDLSWIDNCWEWLNKFNKIIFFGDNDSAGKEMVKNCVQRLGAYRCSVVDCDTKDANELLYKQGKEAVICAVSNAREIPIHGIIDLADVTPLDVRNINYIRTGIKALDETIGGCRYGEMSVWTGKRGEGKSTLMSQMMVNAVELDYKVCVYSGEMKAEDLQYWFNLQVAGKRNIKEFWEKNLNKNMYYLDDMVQKKITEWYRGKILLYDNSIADSKCEETSILKVFEYAVKRYGIKLFIVDNLMTARYGTYNESDFYLRQINFVRDLLEFAAKYKVHVHLVAHPKKTKDALTNDDISGRAEITNLAHNVFSVERIVEDDKKCDVAVKILKNRWEGAKKEIGLNYCPISRRMFMPTLGALKSFGWEDIEIKEPIIEECPF